MTRMRNETLDLPTQTTKPRFSSVLRLTKGLDPVNITVRKIHHSSLITPPSFLPWLGRTPPKNPRRRRRQNKTENSCFACDAFILLLRSLLVFATLLFKKPQDSRMKRLSSRHAKILQSLLLFLSVNHVFSLQPLARYRGSRFCSTSSPSSFQRSRPMRPQHQISSSFLPRTTRNDDENPMDEALGNTEDRNSGRIRRMIFRRRIRRMIFRMIVNIWSLLSAPFPDFRKVSPKRKAMESKKSGVLSIDVKDGIAGFLAYLVLGVITYRFVFDKWSLIDACYYTTVLFLTVGYGDICPETLNGKLFTCIFGISGIALLGTAVASIGSRLVQAENEAMDRARKQSRKRIIQIYEKMPTAVKVIQEETKEGDRSRARGMESALKIFDAIPHPQFPRFIEAFWKAMRYVLQSLFLVACGGLLIGKLEGWAWFDSMYFSLITGTSICKD